VRSSFCICFSALWLISTRHFPPGGVLPGESKPLQLFERDGGFVLFQGRNALQLVFAVFQILPDGLARIIALAAASLLRQGLQFFFEFRFQPNAKHDV